MIKKKILSVAVTIMMLVLMGCAHDHWMSSDRGNFRHVNYTEIYARLAEWETRNACGYLNTKGPLVNVSGRFTTPIKDNTSIFLYIAPTASMPAALSAVEDCRYIQKRVLSHPGEFQLGPLPAGDYFVMTRGDSYIRGQGFPVIDDSKTSDCTLTPISQGGNPSHSITIFSIQCPGTNPYPTGRSWSG